MTAIGKKTLLLFTILLMLTTATMLAGCFGGDVVIKFNTNGGTACEDIVVEKGLEKLELPTTTKDGYDFLGWYRDRSLKVPIDSVLEGADIPDASLTLYAAWQVRNVTVTFSAGDEVVGEFEVPYNTKITSSMFPALTGYDGYEWNTADFYATYDREVRAVGVGGSDEQYFAVYYVPAETGFVEYARFAADGDGNVDVPSDPDAGENAYFDGWYYTSTYTALCETLPTAVPDGDVHLYAHFVYLKDDTKFFFYDETSEGVVITGLTGIGSYQTFVSVPARIDGKNVVRIGGEGKSLTSLFLQTVVIPAGVGEIDDEAFSGCSALVNVVFLGEEITRIGKNAFASCASLTTFPLPDSVTVVDDGAFCGDAALSAFLVGEESKLSYIGEGAFVGCESLTTLTLGKVIRDVGYEAFYGSGLQSLSVYDGGRLKGMDGALYTANGETLVYYPAHGAATFTIPEGVGTVETKAFLNNEDIRSVTASSTLTTIADDAFRGCANLSEIALTGSKLLSVGKGAFCGCESLTALAFPATLESVGDEAFLGCAGVRTLTFGQGAALKTVGRSAFEGCVALTALTLPSVTERLEARAFYGCAAMGTLDLSLGGLLSYVGDYAFYDCVSIGNVLLNTNLTYVGDYAFASKENRMRIEFDSNTDMSGVTHIGEGAFMNTQIVSVTVSALIADNADFGKNVFYGCTYLQQAFLPSAGDEGYDTLPEGTFYGCTSLVRISFPNTVYTIGKRAFYNCGAMEYADFARVTRIEEGAFEGCTGLTNGNGGSQRVLPATLTYLGARAFYACRSLNTVSIPAGLAVIREETFSGCTGLTAILYDAGTTLTTIGENAFAGCTSLVTANLPVTLARKSADDTTGLVKNPFLGCSELREFTVTGLHDGEFTENGLTIAGGVLYVKTRDGLYPELSVYAYPTAGSTGTYIVPARTEIGKTEEGFAKQIIVTGIERYAFFGARITQLNFATITEVAGVEDLVFLAIGDYAFAESSLTTITNLSYRVYSVGEYAFYKCKLLTFSVDGAYIRRETVSGGGGEGDSYIYRDTAGKTKNLLNEEKRENNLLSVGAYAFSETTLPAITLPARVKYVGEGAFSKNYSLSSLTLEGGVTDAGLLTDLVIDDYAFAENNLLTALYVPSSVSSLGNYAFYRCYNVLTVRFGARLVGGYRGPLSIGAYAFGEIHYLYSVTLPANLKYLGEGVFAQNTRLKYVAFAEELATDAGEEMAAPGIPAYAFVGATNMTEITIPAYITGIGAYAFRKTSLTTIRFLGTETDADFTIEEGAFAELTYLTSVELPANLTYVGERAFYRTPLTEVVLGEEGKDCVIGKEAFRETLLTAFTANKRVTAMEEGAFSYIDSLATFRIADDNTALTAYPDDAFRNDFSLSVVTFDGIVEIGEHAFYRTDVGVLTSDDLTRIGVEAFSRTPLTAVTLTGTNVSVEQGAFSQTTRLREARITADTVSVAKDAFTGCDALTTVRIAGSVTLQAGFAYRSPNVATFTIDDGNEYVCVDGVLYADDGATFLYYPPQREGATFELGAEVTAIADYAFYDADGLTGVIVKGEAVTIEEDTFGAGNQLVVYVAEDRVAYYTNEWQRDNVRADITVMGGYVLTLNNLGQYVLTGYLGVGGDVEIAGTITDDGIVYEVSGVGENAFKNNVTIDSVTIGSGVKTIAGSAFENCDNLTRVTIGENVTSVKSYAFYGCDRLSEVRFSTEGSLLSIGNYAFAKCPALTAFAIPDSVETLGIFAFEGDTRLSDVTIGSNVTEIGNNAFAGCAIVRVDVPASVTKIGSYVFSGCENLTYVNMEGRDVVRIENNTFGGTIEGIYFFVPDAAVEKLYKSDSVWREHISKILSAENRLQGIGYDDYVVKENGAGYRLIAYLGTEEDVTIVSDVGNGIRILSIGEYAVGQFARRVTVGEGVRELEQRSFVHAKNLESITLPASLVTIGTDAFGGLKNLSAVTVEKERVRKTVMRKSDYDAGKSVEESVQTVYEFESHLETIGEGAFRECEAITSIEIPESVKTIGAEAFAYTNLTNLTFRHSDVNGTEWYDVNFGTENDPDYQTAKYLSSSQSRGVTTYTTLYKSVYLSVGERAFIGNAGLRTFSLYCCLLSVGTDAFAQCTALESVYLNYNPRTLSNAMPAGTGVRDGVFRSCDKLSVFVPNSEICTLIKSNWTSDVDKYKFVALQYLSDGFVYATINRDSVTVINYIGDETEVTFPSTVRIGTINYNVTRVGREATIQTDAKTQVKGYVIGDRVTKVTLPDKLITVGMDAFRNSASLTTVVMSTGVTTIQAYAFANCKRLVSINIPTTVENIESYAFSGCTSLNEGLRMEEPHMAPTAPTMMIGGYAFENCTGLESFYVTNLVKSIGGVKSATNTSYGHTFEGCENLSTVTFSSGALITRIESYCFANTAIREITFPKKLDTVADSVFYGCPNLARVYLTRSDVITEADSNVFQGQLNAHAKVYVPATLFNSYENAPGWRSKTVIIDSVTDSGEFAYAIDAENSTVVKLTDYRGTSELLSIPSAVKVSDGASDKYYPVSSLGKYFANASVTKAEFVSVTDKGENYAVALSKVEDYAFASCTKLTEIALPDTVTTLGVRAFDGCTALTDVTLSAGLQEISEFTFNNCSSLREITLPANIGKVGNSAFNRCMELARVRVTFGSTWDAANVTGSLGNSAFADTGKGMGDLTVIVPDASYGVMYSGWTDIRSKIYAQASLVGDFVVTMNTRGTAYVLVQYLGTEEQVDLTALTIKGFRIDTIAENAVGNDYTQFIVDEDTEYADADAWRMRIE